MNCRLLPVRPEVAQVFDSTGKYPTGLMQTTTSDLGAFDECIETVEKDSLGAETVRGQYCNLHVNVGNDTSVIQQLLPGFRHSHWRVKEFAKYYNDPRLHGIRIGICVIADCNEGDVQSLVNALVEGEVGVDVRNCVTNIYPRITTTQLVILSFLGVLTLFIATGTSVDMYVRQNKSGHYRYNVPVRVATAFSVFKNTEILLAKHKNKSSDEYRFRFIHGIRFLSMFWITLGHAYVIIGYNTSRVVNVLLYADNWETMILTGGYLAVDTFFFLSGFLLIHNVLKQKRNRLLVSLVAILRRYIRSTVPLVFMMACFYLMPLIASGPDSKSLYAKYYKEVKDHWIGILLQVRNFQGGFENAVLPHIWFLAADFQFFVVSLFVIQLLREHRSWLMAAFGALSIVSCSIATWKVHNTNLLPFLIGVSEKIGTVYDTLNHSYVLPFYHGVCFFTGCITLLLSHSYKNQRVPWILQISAWCISLSCGLCCIFMKFNWYRGIQSTSEATKLLYSFFDRIIWSISLMWISFACTTDKGGYIYQFLSWEWFVPMSRLSFGVYLIHSPFYIVQSHISRERLFYSHNTLVMQCFGVFVWSHLLSYALYIACEAPTSRLERMIFMPETQTGGGRTGVTKNGAKEVNVGDARQAKLAPNVWSFKHLEFYDGVSKTSSHL
ncbi:nose resistant to fluoxetine protein 6 [Ixodes scapularis]